MIGHCFSPEHFEHMYFNLTNSRNLHCIFAYVADISFKLLLSMSVVLFNCRVPATVHLTASGRRRTLSSSRAD